MTKRELEVLTLLMDGRTTRDIASAILRAEGHTVTCVASGAEAIAAVAASPFDVVLMDVRMPDIDGLEATRQIRAQQGSGWRVPIVGLTAQAFAEQVAACHAAGMDDHLAKPFDLDTLLESVKRAIDSRQSDDDEVGREELPETDMIGSSPRMIDIYKTVSRVAPTDATVIIEGETGTG